MKLFCVPLYLLEEWSSPLVLRRGEYLQGQYHALLQFDVVREFTNASLVFAPVDVVFENDQQVDVGIEPALFVAGDAPVQSEFHRPVRRAVDELTTERDGVTGMLVYGSVARGEADRQSDIDLWVLVDERRSRNQQRAAELGRDLAKSEIDGDRYTFHVVVESPDSVPAHTEDIADIVRAGIPVYQTDEFEQFSSLVEGLIDE
jgi:predicted nucleotidyltransferase